MIYLLFPTIAKDLKMAFSKEEIEQFAAASAIGHSALKLGSANIKYPEVSTKDPSELEVMVFDIHRELANLEATIDRLFNKLDPVINHDAVRLTDNNNGTPANSFHTQALLNIVRSISSHTARINAVIDATVI